MSTDTKAISDEIRQAAYDCARGIYLNVDDGGTPYMTDDDILEVAKAIHDAVMAERERCAAVVESFAPGGWNYEYGHDDASMRVAIRGAILADPKSEG